MSINYAREGGCSAASPVGEAVAHGLCRYRPGKGD